MRWNAARRIEVRVACRCHKRSLAQECTGGSPWWRRRACGTIEWVLRGLSAGPRSTIKAVRTERTVGKGRAWASVVAMAVPGESAVFIAFGCPRPFGPRPFGEQVANELKKSARLALISGHGAMSALYPHRVEQGVTRGTIFVSNMENEFVNYETGTNQRRHTSR